jgi:hypothetical protein
MTMTSAKMLTAATADDATVKSEPADEGEEDTTI